ncbi:MAG TPA: hypothetical protein VGV68_10835 [Terriglobia bacterium]|nr:hypothetical protein [Terriglobia bacterium]
MTAKIRKPILWAVAAVLVGLWATAPGPLTLSAYVWVRGCDGNYSVVELTFAGYLQRAT